VRILTRAVSTFWPTEADLKPVPSGRVVRSVVSSGFRSVVALAALPVLLLALPAARSDAITQPASVPAPLLARFHAGAGLGSLAGVATHAQASCGTDTSVVCSQVVVPLDRSGVVPGSITLHVEVVPSVGVNRGVMFLLAGGPGQGSAHVFGLGTAANVSLYRYLFPGYTLVAYDDRGTGDSGLLDCPPLQRANTADAERAAAAACAVSLGAPRDFYSTAAHAEDLDAVRQALGFDKIALYGVSYGTKLAMAYALAHPDHVERLLLDSVLPPELPDPFSANVLRTMPATLAAFCSNGSCRAATGNFAGDVTTLANRLAAKPIRLPVGEPNGTKKRIRVDGIELLSMVIDADLNPGLAAELPAVVRAALQGRPQALARLADLHDAGNQEDAIDLSSALYAATVCRDGPFPWAPDTPVAARPALEQSALAALPPGALGPFGAWAAQLGNADFCLGWPSPSGGAALASGPLPNVPVLAVSGGFDMRTPTAGAASVVARFPQGRLLVVPGVGHSTLTADFSGCAVAAVHTWMTGGVPPTECPRSQPLVAPVPALPGLAATPHRAVSPAATLAIVTASLKEAEAAWLMTDGLSGSNTAVPGVYGGRLTSPTNSSFKLTGYTVAHGVSLSGTFKIANPGPPLRFQGIVTVSGPRAAGGVLGLKAGSLRGTLGGKVVG
jgi:pimeloyl-ACP methyl ester carboxylesterase